MVDCLGHELVECINWRKGALLYMLCSTINGDSNREDQINDEFYMVKIYFCDVIIFGIKG